MAYRTLKDYAERIGSFPSYKTPKYLGKDIEFAYFEFLVPHAWRADTYKDHSNVLPDGWMIDMISLPVMTGIKQMESDETFTCFVCRVPLCLMKTSLGMAYFAPQMKIHNEMPLPSPDHESAIDKAFEKAKRESASPVDCQWELKLKCDCGQEVTEIHETATEGLVARYCGECHSKRLNLVSLKPVEPQGD